MTVELVIEGRARPVGTITVARLLPSARRRLVGPFVFLDHMGPVELAPGAGFDVLPHPHIGLSTVTYFLEGTNVHRDSLGTVQVNRPHDLNLMTAGRGVVHSERADPEFRDRGGTMHGIQIWLALPAAHEDDAPSFAHHPAATLPTIAPADGVRARVLLGTAWHASSPAIHPSDPLLVYLELEPDAVLAIPPLAAERALFVIDGAIDVGDAALGANTLGVLAPDTTASLCVRERTRAMLIGGPPIGSRFIDWNFVATTRERIEAARAAWAAQAFPRIPDDDREFVPYPDPAPM